MPDTQFKEMLDEEMLALTPNSNSWDLGNLLALRLDKGVKFGRDDFPRPGHIAHDIAADYAKNYKGDFGFMIEMKSMYRRGQLQHRHTAGIINCWYNDVRGLQIRHEDAARRQRFSDNTVVDEGSGDTVATNATVEDGYYTFSFKDGSHLTIRVRVKQGDPNTQKVSALVGPDNQNDYQPFGFLKGTRYVPFSAFRQGYDRWHFVAKAMLGMDDKEKEMAGLLYAQRSTRCYKCGIELTDPVSISLGIGPTCRNKE